MPRRVDKAAKRERLISAAARVFAETGYAATRMEAVADAAGVSKAALYLYFESKEALFHAVFARFSEIVREGLDEAAATGGTRDRLHRVADFWVGAIRDNRALIPIVLEFWAAAAAGESRARFADELAASYAEARRLVAGILADGQGAAEVTDAADTEALAAALVAALDGLYLQVWLAPDLDAAAAATAAVDAVLDGVAPPAAD